MKNISDLHLFVINSYTNKHQTINHVIGHMISIILPLFAKTRDFSKLMNQLVF